MGAVGTPVLIGVLIFIATVASVVILVLAQPHAPVNEAGPEAESAASEGQSALNESTTQPASRPDGANAATSTEIVYVHVVGEVHSPGVVELKLGDRVQQALEAAGGVTKKAVLEGVNLARSVSDGEQIVVPDSNGASVSEDGTQTQESSGTASSAPVNLNTAGADQLESLPRVGPSLAQRIIDWRKANGAFSSIDQLLEVSGIGQKTLDGFQDRILV